MFLNQRSNTSQKGRLEASASGKRYVTIYILVILQYLNLLDFVVFHSKTIYC
jgi:hypothetical protein